MSLVAHGPLGFTKKIKSEKLGGGGGVAGRGMGGLGRGEGGGGK